MKVLSYKSKIGDKIVLCLGYFDAIHKGHSHLIKSAKSYAESNGFSLATLVFTGGKNGRKDVFTLPERLSRISRLGADYAILKKLGVFFRMTSPERFLNDLFRKYDIAAIFTGSDFTYGKHAAGNAKTLCDECEKRGVYYSAEPLLTYNGKKISSCAVRSALAEGDTEKAQFLLGSPYFMSGKVVKGRKIGRTIGFPTANFYLPRDKFPLKEGVYQTLSSPVRKVYNSITNVGTQPTVKGKRVVIETYIDGFSGDLYGKLLPVFFVKRLRDVEKFNDINELKNQLESDIKTVRENSKI